MGRYKLCNYSFRLLLVHWCLQMGLYHDHDSEKVSHDGHSNENVNNGVLLINRQIHDIIGHISPSCVFGRHGCGHYGLWPSLSDPLQVTY